MSSLADASRDALDKLHDLCNSGPGSYLDFDDGINLIELQSRLQAWADNIGACQPSSKLTSLAYRTSKAPKLQDLFLARLRDLLEDLEDCKWYEVGLLWIFT